MKFSPATRGRWGCGIHATSYREIFSTELSLQCFITLSILEGGLAAASVLISFGAVIGKFNPFQLLLLALVESREAIQWRIQHLISEIMSIYFKVFFAILAILAILVIFLLWLFLVILC